MLFRFISFMKKIGDISDFIRAVNRGDSTESTRVVEHIGIIIRQWCRKNKCEISWVAFHGKVCDDHEIVKKIYDAFIDKIIMNEIHITGFIEYKNSILEIGTEVLKNGFTDFNDLLIIGDNKAWKKVQGVLQVYTRVWLSKRKLAFLLQPDELHHVSLHTLFEKMAGKNLRFDSSYALKSYYFSILENKSREENRERLRAQRFTNDIPDQYEDDTTQMNDDLLCLIKEQIARLDGMEKLILVAYFTREKKLTEIAAELNITPENCRVIKCRAMKRLIQAMPGK